MEIKENEERELSSIRKNIISWYPFNGNSNVLVINNTCNEIIEELNRKCNNITTINNLSDNETKRYNYIFINSIEETQYTLQEYLQFAKKHLEENGTILFTCDNKYGFKNYNINCKIETKKNYFSKKEIESVLKQLNIENYKFYYPLPNYKIPNVIFTDKHLPDKESILRDLTLYDEDEILVLDEREQYKEVIKENPMLFTFFANSFLVEISLNDNKIEFISFNNSRKEKYRIRTVINNEIVYKQANDESGMQHFKEIEKNIEILNNLNLNSLDTFKNEMVYSKIMPKEKQFDKILIAKFNNKEEEEAVSLIKKFVSEIKEKLFSDNIEGQTIFEKYNIKVDKEINNKFNYTKFGLFDLIFQNCFYEDGKFYFYDQEWFEENIPIEFIIYRAIEYLANSSLKITKKDLFERFELLEYIEIFQELEKTLQEKIKNETIWSIHALNRTTVKNLYDTQIHYRNLNSIANEEKNNQKIIIEQQEKKINELNNKLNIIKNSKSWKLTEPLRKIRGKLK